MAEGKTDALERVCYAGSASAVASEVLSSSSRQAHGTTRPPSAGEAVPSRYAELEAALAAAQNRLTALYVDRETWRTKASDATAAIKSIETQVREANLLEAGVAASGDDVHQALAVRRRQVADAEERVRRGLEREREADATIAGLRSVRVPAPCHCASTGVSHHSFLLNWWSLPGLHVGRAEMMLKRDKHATLQQQHATLERTIDELTGDLESVCTQTYRRARTHDTHTHSLSLSLSHSLTRDRRGSNVPIRSVCRL